MNFFKLVKLCMKLFSEPNKFFAERGYSLPIEYYDPFKGQLSDSYSFFGKVWIMNRVLEVNKL